MANELLEQRRAQMFPKLTAAQISRLQALGRLTETRPGQTLLEPGDRERGLFIVISGSLEIRVRGSAAQDLIHRLTAGEFSGEMSTLRGSAALVIIRVGEGGEVLTLDGERLRTLVQNDAELSELFMRAFILRRMALIAAGNADVMLLGSRHSADTLRLREFLSRNAVPYLDLDIDSDADVKALLERFHVQASDIPVVVCRLERVLKNPTNRDIAECLGMNPLLDDAKIHDLLIVGAGPAGLAAAVYAASEGLDVRVVETTAAGGQAGTSSKIENYLGFPTGISGQALAGRALSQAQKFGAHLSVVSQATRLHCDSRPYALELADASVIRAHAVIIASGAQYRLLQIDNLSRFLGVGVYAAATFLEAKLCRGDEAIVVGGGNSAGQAAVFLANTCRHVHILVRSAGLAESMSNYLIRRINELANITLHIRTQIMALDGDGRLESVSWSSNGGPPEQHAIGHVFLMTGALPNTAWLQGCVALDAQGFVKTGSDLQPEELSAAHWTLPRAPYLMETTLAGVFAVGDARSGSVKRIASAVGEGSICVQFVHRALRDVVAQQQHA